MKPVTQPDRSGVAGARDPHAPRPAPRPAGVRRRRSQGQALVIIAMSLTVLFLFVGLGVDVANLLARRAKLQSAVDSAALSAAQSLYSDTQARATTRANEILVAAGIPTSTLVLPATVDFPPIGNQVHVAVTQHVDTYFVRLIPAWVTIDISVEATADTASYAEIQSKPYGIPGVVNELNLMVWGTLSQRGFGDAYSPQYIDSAGNPNPLYSQQPYGYLYRIDVPNTYLALHNTLVVQIFDPDSYNRPDAPPTPCPFPANGCVDTADMHAYCPSYSVTCTTGDPQYNTGLKLNAFASGRPAFWRVDEVRPPYNGSGDGYSHVRTTTTTYTLWHFSPHNTTAFGDPTTLSDYPSGGTPTSLASYTVQDDVRTDLRWYQPPNFSIVLDPFERETNGSVYLYLYVQGTNGSSENNFDLRVGPPSNDPHYQCTDLPAISYNSPCYVNAQYFNNVTDWQDGGARIFAKKALPLNLDSGSSFPLTFAQISKNAAGQTLSVRHFDQDCNNSCGSLMDYQMLKCNADASLDASWEHVAYGYVGPTNDWYCSGCEDPETVQIPVEGSTLYNDFFTGTPACQTSWLRIKSNPSYPQDTTVWELPFLRPRLIK